MFPDVASYDNGTQVALVSGGPAMTVIGGKDGYSLVAWFIGEQLQQALFPVEALFCLDEEEDDVLYANEDGETLH
jgi:uncharacterized protein YodC (DUF2158 family)